MATIGINDTSSRPRFVRSLVMTLGLFIALSIAGRGQTEYTDQFNSRPGGDSTAHITTGTPEVGLDYQGSAPQLFLWRGADMDVDSFGLPETIVITSRNGDPFTFHSLRLQNDSLAITIRGEGDEPFTINVPAGAMYATYSPAGGSKLVDRVTMSANDIWALLDDVHVTFPDFEPPSLDSFERLTPSTAWTNADTLVFRATFDEDVKNVTHGDFLVTGTTALLIGVTEIYPAVYDLTVSGGDLAGYDGTVGIDLAAGQDIADLSDNPLPSGEPAVDETYLLDNTPPTDPTPASSSHTADVWDNDNTVDIQISGATDGGSGVDGFEVEWDTSDTWMPSETKEQDETWAGATFTAITDGDWYFHIATVDNAGNWSGGTTFGPFRIDTTPPSVPTGLDPADGSYTTDTSPLLSWSASTDTGSGMQDTNTYRIVVTGPNPRDDYVSDTDYNPTGLSEGTYKWKLYSRDNAGNLSSYTAETTLYIDATPPIDPATVESTSHTTSTWASDPTIDVRWLGASDAITGVAGYSYSWGANPAGVPDTTQDLAHTADPHTIESPTLSDGNSHWLHIRTVDLAGNWTSTEHLGPFWIDTTAPTNPTLDCTSHTAGVWSNNDYVQFYDYPTSSDASSGVDGYEDAWTTSPTWVPAQVKTMEEIVLNTGAHLPDGEWYYHIATIDNAGNWAAHDTYGPYRIDTVSPNVTVEQAAGQSDPTSVSPVVFTVTFDEEIDIGTFDGSDVVVGGTADTEDPAIGWLDLKSYSLTIPVTSDGTVTVTIPAGGIEDYAGNTNTASTSNDNEVAVDMAQPDVTIDQDPSQDDPTNGADLLFIAVFSESIDDGTFAAGDVQVGGTPGAVVNVSELPPNDGTTFRVTVHPPSDGTAVVSIPAGGVEDLVGNTNNASTSTDNEVTFDTTPPTVASVTVNDTLLSDADAGEGTFEVAIRFSESMDPTHDHVPTISFTPDVTVGPQTLDVDGYEWTSSVVTNDTVRWTVDVIDEDQDVDAVAIDVDGGRDLAGNNVLPYAPEVEFEIDMLNPTVLALCNVSGGASMFRITDRDAGGVFGLAADFSEEMDPNANPTLTFDPDITTGPIHTLENPTCIWEGDPVNQRVATFFDVVDQNVDVPGISVRVTDARDSAGNPVETYTLGSWNWVDTLNPTVTSVAASDLLIEQDDIGGVFTVTISYSEAMDTATTPTVGFTPAVDSTLLLTGGTWVEDDVYRTRYEILDEDEKLLHVHVNIDGARDALGNAQVLSRRSSVFGIDTITPPEGTVIVAPMGAGGDDTFLDRCLPLEDGEDPPSIAGQPLSAVYEIGEPITGGCKLHDRHGEADRNSYLIIELYRLDLGEGSVEQDLLLSTQVRYAHDHGYYHFRIDTTDLVPGTYDVRLVFKDGTSCRVRIQLVEAPAE